MAKDAARQGNDSTRVRPEGNLTEWNGSHERRRLVIVARVEWVAPAAGGRYGGRDGHSKPPGEDVEVAQVHDAVVCEVALCEVAVRLPEVGGEEVEIAQVDPRVVVRVALEEEELVDEVPAQWVAGRVGDARAAERRAVAAVGDDVVERERGRARGAVPTHAGDD